MQIKKRYIKEEIERLEKLRDIYYGLARTDQHPYTSAIATTTGQIKGLQWVLDFN